MFGSVRLKFVLTFCVLLTVNGRAQSMREIHEKIDSAMARIGRFYDVTSTRDGVDYYDSLETVSGELTEYLVSILPKTPESLSANFEEIPFVWVASSPDHKMRAWSWDTWTGGTMPEMRCLIEYQTPKGIKVFIDFDTTEYGSEGGNNGWIDTFYSVRSRGDRTYYLPRKMSKGSTVLTGQDICAYAIDDTTLNREVQLFQTPKQLLNTIGFAYDMFSNYDEKAQRQRHFIELLADGKTLSIPVVRETKKYPDGAVTSKTIRYVFDGVHFVYKGIVK